METSYRHRENMGFLKSLLHLDLAGLYNASCQEIIGFVIINITMKKKLETSRRIIIIISSAISHFAGSSYGFLWFRFYKVMVAKEFWIKWAKVLDIPL